MSTKVVKAYQIACDARGCNALGRTRDTEQEAWHDWWCDGGLTLLAGTYDDLDRGGVRVYPTRHYCEDHRDIALRLAHIDTGAGA